MAQIRTSGVWNPVWTKLYSFTILRTVLYGEIIIVLCISPRDYNENKIFLDLYYAVPATVFLDVLVMILL